VPRDWRGAGPEIIEDLEVTLESLREELHVYASNRGGMVGPITLIDSGDEIDCARMGSGVYSIPSIFEADVIRFKSCDA
jgi:DNA topoisomerase-6 subunit A